MMQSTSSANEDFSSSKNKGHPQKPTSSRRPLLTKFLGLSMLSGIIVYFYSSVISEMNNRDGLARGGMAGGLLETQEDDVSRRLSQEDWDERVLEVIKASWPECVNQRMNGIHCKTFIDEEILTLFTGDDRLTRTVLKGKRSILDVFYNSVVILMDDDDRVAGRDADGMVYYDFPWEGSGRYVTDEEDSDIPPVICEEENGELVCEDEPVLVRGCTLQKALDEECDGPLNGGVVIDPKAENCNADVDADFQTRLDDAKTLEITPAGERDLPAFDCTCLTGYACCLLIKATVRDADAYNKAIQCHLNYVPTSAKSKLFDNGRGKKVNIYTNHNFVVSKVPFVEGSWVYDNALAPVPSTV